MWSRMSYGIDSSLRNSILVVRNSLTFCEPKHMCIMHMPGVTCLWCHRRITFDFSVSPASSFRNGIIISWKLSASAIVWANCDGKCDGNDSRVCPTGRIQFSFCLAFGSGVTLKSALVFFLLALFSAKFNRFYREQRRLNNYFKVVAMRSESERDSSSLFI